jgi:tetratricopeptide (TPR) repeat protein
MCVRLFAAEYLTMTMEDEEVLEQKPNALILAYCLRGRLLGAKGQYAEAEAEFERAVALGERLQLWLPVLLALRDIRVCLEGHSRQLSCDRRMGAVLRRMNTQPARLSALLNKSFAINGKVRGVLPSFDAAAIMRL